jgi:hypothetical protein
MRILVIGAGRTGIKVIKQLRKNPDMTIIVADPRPQLLAVDQGVIDHVDIRESLTPLTLNRILGESRPDLVLLAMPPEDMGLGKAAGIEIFVEALGQEIASLAKVPIIDVARAT